SGLVWRLHGKQGQPEGYVSPAPARPKAKPRAKAEASDLPRPVLASEAASSSGSSSSSRPRRQREDDVEDSAGTAINIGSQVRVKGDGWGGGFGEYDGTVTEQDELSLTVIFKSVETKKWEETQVLREHCQPITDAEETPAQQQAAAYFVIRR
ncbi:unnamed protein product, partial [Polarella glacialis]